MIKLKQILKDGIYALFALCLFFLASCSFVEQLQSENEEFTFLLPSNARNSENQNVEVEYWDVFYTDGINEGKAEKVPSQKSVSVYLGKNCAAAVLAYPVLQEGNFAYPAGAVLPENRSLAAQNGFAASLLYSMYKESPGAESRDFLSRFNWPKLELLVQEFENEWLLDKERIMKAIASGKFRKSDIRLKKEM